MICSVFQIDRAKRLFSNEDQSAQSAVNATTLLVQRPQPKRGRADRGVNQRLVIFSGEEERLKVTFVASRTIPELFQNLKS